MNMLISPTSTHSCQLTDSLDHLSEVNNSIALYKVRRITVINVISLLLDYAIKQLIMCW